MVLQGTTPTTVLQNVGLEYDLSLGATLWRNDYDSLTGGLVAYLTVNPATATGYFLTPDTANLTPYTLFTTQLPDVIDSSSLYRPGPSMNQNTPVGYFDHKNGDTVFLQAVGQGMRTGMEMAVEKCLYRQK
jgi:hypothetical protein